MDGHSRQYVLGIVLLLLVVLLWTASNFITKRIFDNGYDKPFLLTYICTSTFALYLLPFYLKRRWQSPKPYQPLPTSDAQPADPMQPLTVRQTADLAFAFCLVWFVANWTVNASLGYTTVASATVLSSMSGFFTLGIGRLFRVEQLSLLKVGAVCTSFAGVALVSWSDSRWKDSAPSSPINTRAALGDLLALSSALFYAIYVVLLKVKIKVESRIDMQLFFGFVGLFNILTCWPIGVLLHVTGIEPFALPRTSNAYYALLLNMAITLTSDYLYVLAMLKTTPLVVTVGLSLTIPLAVIGDFFFGYGIRGEVIVGAILVLGSFVAVGLGDSKDNEVDGPRTVTRD